MARAIHHEFRRDVCVQHAGDGADTPVGPEAELPLRAAYFPLGFPLEVFSNSPAVMEAAKESWERFPSRFVDTPLELRLEVEEGDDNGSTLPPAPVCRLQWNTLVHIADARNFAVTDLRRGRSFGSITRAMAAAPLYLRYYFLEAAALSMITALRAAPIHAACVCPHGPGMLLTGDSGAGKSSLAYAGARAGWTYISDDASYLPLSRNDRLVIGNQHQIRFRSRAVELFPELEGRPVTPRAGKESIEVPTAELPGLTTSDSAVIEYVVFLNRRHVGGDALTPLSRDFALRWFRQWCYTAPEEVRTVQYAALEHLLAVPIYELRYRDLDWAVDRLERLAKAGR